MGWEHFEHGADIGVRGVGPTKAVAFEQAALALSAVLTNPESVQASETVEIECAAPDDEMLLVRWLNALVYEMAVRRMLFRRFEVVLDEPPAGAPGPLRLRAKAHGEPVNVARHEPAVEVKGATCTALRVGRNAAGQWIAQTVVDV